MRALIDVSGARAFAVPGRVPGTAGVEGMLIEGPQGWGEFSPRCEAEASRAFVAATEAGTVGWPDPVRGRIPVAATVGTADPAVAAEIVAATGVRTLRVPIGARPHTDGQDRARLRAARSALGDDGCLRPVLEPGWGTAAGLAALIDDAGGVQFVEVTDGHPEAIARLRGQAGVPVAAPVTDADPRRLADYADIAVLSVAALGGVRRALRLAELTGLPAVVNSPGESSLGIAAGLALAGALAELPFDCGLGDLGRLAGDLVERVRMLAPVDGRLPVAPMPPAPDPRQLDRFAVSDPARWHELLVRVARGGPDQSAPAQDSPVQIRAAAKSAARSVNPLNG
ncbi:MAG: O-succinylbenzoate synthase [Mycolicibacterium insubricum]|nr:O-succinylbenzoate synthase [Mycobacterium sp.]